MKIIITIMFLVLYYNLGAQIEIRTYNNPFISVFKLKHNYYNDIYREITFNLINKSPDISNIAPINAHLACLKNIKNNWWFGFEYCILQHNFYSEYTFNDYKPNFSFNSNTYTYHQTTETKSGIAIVIEKRLFKRNKAFINISAGLYGGKISSYTNTVEEVYSSLNGEYSKRENVHQYVEKSSSLLPGIGFHTGYTFCNGAIKPMVSAGLTYFKEEGVLFDQYGVYVNSRSNLLIIDFGIGLQFSFIKQTKPN